MNRADRCSVRTCWSFGVTQTNQFLGEVWVNERGQRPSRPLTPRRSWLRGLDLNQRPLGYERKFGNQRNQGEPSQTNDDIALLNRSDGTFWLVSVGLLHSRFIGLDSRRTR